MSYEISVVLSTHDPNRARFQRTLEGLNHQSLEVGQWELIVVDNASNAPIGPAEVARIFSGNLRMEREDRLGLTFGRLKGIAASTSELVVFLDDDNVVAPPYLENSLAIFRRRPRLGLGGGRSIPEWDDKKPEAWVKNSYLNLALRDLGHVERVASLEIPRAYPECAPIGAGMIARRAALTTWTTRCTHDGAPTGRRGKATSSGEDCDMVMFALRDGWEVGYFPELNLTHLIPSTRLSCAYLGRLNYGISKSWVEVLARHGIYPWPPAAQWSIPLRKLRAFFREQAWAGPGEYVRWRGDCGQFDGRALISRTHEVVFDAR